MLYVNKISSNTSHLLQDIFLYMQDSKEVSIIFLKNGWWQNSMQFREKKKDICVDLFVCVFHKFQGDSRFLHKIPGYFQDTRSQNKFQAFQGFQGAVGILI